MKKAKVDNSAEGIIKQASEILARRREQYPEYSKEASIVSVFELAWDMLAKNREQVHKSKTPLRMVFTKIAREAHAPKLDNILDAINYLALYAAMVYKEE